MTEPKKTHVERKSPQISLSRLADYMAASEQAKRGIATSCKFQPIARVIQYNDAKAIISNYIRSENREIKDLKHKLEILQSKICDSDFEEDVKTHNCNYVSRFIALHYDFDFKDYTYSRPVKFDKIVLNGMPVSVQADVLTSRMTRTNKRKIGALMLRYAKGKPLSEKAGLHQSAFLYEFFRQPQFSEQGESEKALCITLDAHSAIGHEAPGNATYLFKEMAATCANLMERWPAIKPPPGAVL
jgi:hypothetical protein